MVRPRQNAGEKGQGLIFLMLCMTVIFVVGFIVVDVGLWLTERRGAQKDADASTLAGAYELLEQDFLNPANNDPIAIRAAARAAVDNWADFNGLPLADVRNVVIDDTDCFGPSNVIDTVELDAEHHEKPLFVSIFELAVPEIGAPAKACLGSENTAEGLLPLGVQITGPKTDCWQDTDNPPDGEEDPLYGEKCVISFGAGETESGEAGHVRLFNDGSASCSDNNTGGGNTWSEEIENGGANTLCHVYKYFSDPSKYDPADPSTSCSYDPGGCVFPQTGVGGSNTLDAFHDLISKETTAGYDCDEKYGSDADSIDDLLEAVEVINGAPWPSSQAIFAKRDCKSPRTVSLLIVKQFAASGNPPMPIEAFASFFIERCKVENNQGIQYSDTCNKDEIQGQIGQVQLEGYFLNILGTDGGVGQITKWSPKRIVLVE